jgi:hypothetical protein
MVLRSGIAAWADAFSTAGNRARQMVCVLRVSPYFLLERVK